MAAAGEFRTGVLAVEEADYGPAAQATKSTTNGTTTVLQLT